MPNLPRSASKVYSKEIFVFLQQEILLFSFLSFPKSKQSIRSLQGKFIHLIGF